jgi:hypothetical protein
MKIFGTRGPCCVTPRWNVGASQFSEAFHRLLHALAVFVLMAIAPATLAAPSPGVPISGIMGLHVVAVDAETGSVIAGTLGGWSCDAANPPTQFDGSFDLERLPVGHTYNLYAEPLLGLALPGDFSDVFTGLCSSSVAPACTAPPVNTNFNVRILPATQ